MPRHPAATILALASALTFTGIADAEYQDAERLAAKLRTLANRSSAASLNTFGQSRQGRPLWVLTLASPGAPPAEDRTALLVTAGIDGDRPAGPEVAVIVAEKLIDAFATNDEAVTKLLSEHTVYVLPRINPDAQERFFSTPRGASPYTTRPIDDDRDGVVDEDGPTDLNGDGWITMMRVEDPQATHLADKDHPRLIRKADRAKDERPVYKVYVEGLDDDGDGEYNEDPPGGVDLNANFPHGYQEHAWHVGPYQLSEPEARALVDFVLNHSRIAMAVTYGRHNNLLEIDGSGKKNDTDKAPVALHEDDADIYKFVGERFKEITGIKKAPTADNNGAFHAWAYAQYGIPSFATSIWQRPEPEKKEGDDADGKEGDAEAKKTHEKPAEAKEKPPRRGGRRGRRNKGKDKDKKKEPAENLDEDIAWLEYSDDVRHGDGFVDWAPFQHPTLGAVEIGGFKPYFKTVPPDGAIAALAEAQYKFLVDVGARFPDIKLDHVEVIEQNANVFEITALLRNDGYFPSGLAMAEQNRRVRPIVVTLDVGLDAILGGERVHRVWRVDGEGGAYELRWVVRGARGTSVTIDVTSEKYGDFNVEVPLKSNVSGTTGGAR